MTEKTTTETPKPQVQNLSVSAAALALSWIPFVTVSDEGETLLRRSNYSSILGASGVFDAVGKATLLQYRDNATDELFYVLNLDGKDITFEVQSSGACHSYLASPVSSAGLSFRADLIHKQNGLGSVLNATEWELSIQAYDPQGQRKGFALIQLEVCGATVDRIGSLALGL